LLVGVALRGDVGELVFVADLPVAVGDAGVRVTDGLPVRSGARLVVDWASGAAGGEFGLGAFGAGAGGSGVGVPAGPGVVGSGELLGPPVEGGGQGGGVGGFPREPFPLGLVGRGVGFDGAEGDGGAAACRVPASSVAT
jgi:hypothetical protein